MPVATLPAAAPRGFWALLQEMGADFAMGSGLLGGFRGRCAVSNPMTWGNAGAV